MAIRTAKEKAARAAVRRAMKQIGMTGILQVIAEHCDDQSSNAPDYQQVCYGRIRNAVVEASRIVTAATADDFNEPEVA